MPQTESPKCPRCGVVMVQKFNEKPGPRGITLAIPTGKYDCLRCGYDPEKKSEGD